MTTQEIAIGVVRPSTDEDGCCAMEPSGDANLGWVAGLLCCSPGNARECFSSTLGVFKRVRF
jgi:hypothetical protein